MTHTFSRGGYGLWWLFRGLLCIVMAVQGYQAQASLVQQAAEQPLLSQGAPLSPAGLQEFFTQETQLNAQWLSRATQNPQGSVDGVYAPRGPSGRARQSSQCLSNEVHQCLLQRPATRAIVLPKQELQQGLHWLGSLPQTIPEHRDSFWAEPEGPALPPLMST